MDFLKKNIVLVLAFLIIISVIIAILVNTVVGPGVNRTVPIETSSPAPLVTEIPKPESGKPYQIVTLEEEEQLKKDRVVGQLIKKLPHQEENFNLIYRISDNSFIVTLNRVNLDLANRDFDEYLRANGILSREWLYNLSIE